MKKLLSILLIAFSMQGFTQTAPVQHHTHFELGSGLNFAFNDSAYLFKISGMVQPYMSFEQLTDQDAEYFFNARRTYFNISGTAVKEKVDFFIQMDYSQPNALLDAWIRYRPIERLSITFGQKQTIGNNREMMIMEDRLQFPGRSILSTTFSNSGREFGVYADYTFGTDVLIIPQVGFTSGDGKNSFGEDSRDIDVGGFKYAARLDIYPLGAFSQGNTNLVADLAHEETPKLVVGGAASFNDGASEPVGEGHGEFILFNQIGEAQQPDYRQVYGDLLVKFKGFSFLGEYVVATATNLEGTYIEPTGTDLLLPTNISQYLALGSAYNLQLGYTTRSGFGLDLRYSNVKPEFEENLNSIVQEQDAWTVGLVKYFKGNDLKVQGTIGSVSQGMDTDLLVGQLMIQAIF